MFKIYPSGSDIQYESVRFQDLELTQDGTNALFVPKFPTGPGDIKPSAVSVSEAKKKTDENLLKDETTELEAIKKEAYTKGRIAGRQESEKKFHSAVQAFGEGLEQINGLRKSLLESSKEDMVRLIMAVAKKVIQTEIEKNKEIIIHTVNKALQSAIEADEYYIKVHPEDLQIVSEKEPLFLASMKGLQNIHFISDETISRGGCIAESRSGEVDATIESQLDEIYKHLYATVCQANKT